MKDFITPDKWVLPVLWFLAGVQIMETGAESLRERTFLGLDVPIFALAYGLLAVPGGLLFVATAVASLIYAIRTIRT